MIGLGSNRLTVCRRGGMSVTQAGRGGMEWLAGGRSPLWASPYSAQATDYLQQHYAAYWNDIMAFGFNQANAKYLPYIEEDYDFICSLMNVGKTRWLNSTGGARINTGLYANSSTEYYVEIMPSSVGGEKGVIGGRFPFFLLQLYSASSIRPGIGGSSSWVVVGTPSLLNRHTKIRMTQTQCFVDGELKASYTASPGTGSSNIWLFAVSNSGSLHGGQYYGGISRAEITGTTRDLQLVPYKRKDGGNEICCMIDLNAIGVEGRTLYFNNANSSGSFTISETPAS